ncbi:hypothetical protein GCM10023081_09260 [Arthrobacter ginkgonis]|uniref:Uncharacterized protein n=1 Tax=Arthrobacter ginkgonis TaxID=1630594 RepID=A0ABP7BXR9_9MICC
MDRESSLNSAQLASIDLLIAIAQQNGLSLEDRLEKTQEQAEAQADRVEAMWEARHGGLEITEHDLQVIGKIRELAATLESSVTLKQLIELRDEALKSQG